MRKIKFKNNYVSKIIVKQTMKIDFLESAKNVILFNENNKSDSWKKNSPD